MKKIIRKIINKFGYDIIKKNSDNFRLELYRELFSSNSLVGKKFYNIGAGNFHHPYWTNVDFYNNWYKEIQKNVGIHFDLMKCESLPIDANSAEVVYTSHVIEHVTDDAVKNMFGESYRILKKGGMLRVTAPDVNLWFRAFQGNDRIFFRDSIKHYSNPLVMNTLELNSMEEATIGSIFQYYFSAMTSPLTKCKNSKKITDEELNKIFYEKDYEDALTYICSFSKFNPNKAGYHINWANSSKVIKLLKEVGFTNVYVSAYGQSVSPILRNISLFDNTVPEWSFYVEAIK